ncbi:MAG: hypothetical protein Q9208_004263 [Pyrenodesmia sp. 3 TL-2023]
MASGLDKTNATGLKDTQQLLKTLDAISAESFEDDGLRCQALLVAYTLVSRLETPWETIARLCMGQPALGAALKVAKDLQLFNKWHDCGNGEMTSDELASIVSCDPSLLVRLLRHLAANHLVQQPTVDSFKPTTFTRALLQPVYGEWINHLSHRYDATIPCFFKLPDYLARTGYQSPSNPSDGVFQYTKGYDGDAFEYFKANPREGESFNHVMGGVMANQASWLDIYPHTSLLDSRHDLPLLVDVGGNVGHDLDKFRQRYPDTAARLYLQDRPEVVRRSKCPDPVNKMGYDFFTPQPIRGARVYYMHGVLHDWPDEPACRILKMQKDALTPGHSTLLIHDHIVSEAPVHPHTTAYDLTMMVMVAGEERTEAKWRQLLMSAGYEMVKIWKSPMAVQGIIEARVVG